MVNNVKYGLNFVLTNNDYSCIICNGEPEHQLPETMMPELTPGFSPAFHYECKYNLTEFSACIGEDHCQNPSVLKEQISVSVVKELYNIGIDISAECINTANIVCGAPYKVAKATALESNWVMLDAIVPIKNRLFESLLKKMVINNGASNIDSYSRYSASYPNYSSIKAWFNTQLVCVNVIVYPFHNYTHTVASLISLCKVIHDLNHNTMPSYGNAIIAGSVTIDFNCTGNLHNNTGKVALKHVNSDGTSSVPSFGFNKYLKLSKSDMRDDIIKYLEYNMDDLSVSDKYVLHTFVHSMELHGFSYKIKHNFDDNSIFICIDMDMKHDLEFIDDYFHDKECDYVVIDIG